MMFLRVPGALIFMGESVATLFSTLWAIWKEMASAVWSVIPKIISFILWAISGIIILPCVFVAGSLYPMWQEWGEDM